MDPSTVDRSSPASSIHSNSSHSNHSLRIVIPDEPSTSQVSVSRKQMLLNQYRKEQSIKTDSSNEGEPEVFQNIHILKKTNSSDHDHTEMNAIDPSSSSESENIGTQEEKDMIIATTPEICIQTEDGLDLEQDSADKDDNLPGPSHENRSTSSSLINTERSPSNHKVRKPNPLISDTKKCQVCSAPAAKHVHYGATTCFSCRAFFRRSIQTSQSRNYVCRRQGNCKILPDTRKGCQKCRLDACLKIGMKPGWVLNEDERARRFRKQRQKKVEKGEENLNSNLIANANLLDQTNNDGEEQSQLKRLTPSPTAYEKRRRLEYMAKDNIERDDEQSKSLGYKRMYLQLRDGQKNVDGVSVSDSANSFSDSTPTKDYKHFKKGNKKHEILHQNAQDNELLTSNNTNLAASPAQANTIEERRRFPRLDNNPEPQHASQPSFHDEISEKSIAFLRNKPAELAAIRNDPAARIWLNQPSVNEFSANIDGNRMRNGPGNNLDRTFNAVKPDQLSFGITHSSRGIQQKPSSPNYTKNRQIPTTSTIVANEIESIYRNNQNFSGTGLDSFAHGRNEYTNNEQSRYVEPLPSSSYARFDYPEQRQGFLDANTDLNKSGTQNSIFDQGRASSFTRTPERQQHSTDRAISSPERNATSMQRFCQKPLSVAARLEGMLVGPGEDEIRIVNEFVDQHDKNYKSINFGEDLIKEMIMSSIFGIPMSANTAMSAYRLMVQRVTKVSKNFIDFRNLSFKAQGTLLKHNADLVVSLRGAAFFYMKTGLDQILTSLGFEDLETAKNMILTTLKSNSTKETDYKKIDYKKFNTIQKTAEQSALERKYDCLLAKIGAAVSFNQNLVKILSYILMFCSDFSDDEMDISDRTNIEQAQEKVILISQRYIYATYPEEMASSVYSNLMECIGNLRELVFIKSKRANIQEHKNDIKAPPTMVH